MDNSKENYLNNMELYASNLMDSNKQLENEIDYYIRAVNRNRERIRLNQNEISDQLIDYNQWAEKNGKPKIEKFNFRTS